jgi:SP family galactose:H+ symporter-like MFS transporter
MQVGEQPRSPYKSTAYIVLYGLLLASGGLFYGYLIGTFNNFGDAFLQNIYSVSAKEDKIAILGNLNFYFLVGGLLSTVTASFIFEALGRYKSILLMCLAKIAVLCLFLVQNIYVLYVGRFVGGYLGCFSTFIVPLMIKETIPLKYAGTLSASFAIFITGGILIAYGVGSPDATAYWRLVLSGLLITEVPTFFMFLFYFKMESPKSIFANSRSLKDDLYENYLYIYTEEGAKEQAEIFMQDMNSVNESASTITIGEVLGPQYRLQFLLGFMLNVLNQLTGINFLIFYSKSIFEKIGLQNAESLTFYLGAINFFGAIFVTNFGALIGKRPILTSGLGVQSVSYFAFLCGLILKNGLLVVIGAYSFVFAFSVSLGGMMYVYLADIVPPIGISFASIGQWVVACVVGKYAMVITEAVGEFQVFYFFMITSFIGCILFAGYSVETQGKTDSQIKSEFAHKKFMS